MSNDTLLTIAGFDPSSGAGITADLAVFAAHGFFGTSCITALTVQSTVGVRETQSLEADFVTRTLACLEDDLPAAGVKIGMLGTRENVEAVASFLKEKRAARKIPVVLDPVLRATSGRELLSPDGLAAMRAHLLPLVDWVTPNRAELAALTGRAVESPAEMEAASRELAAAYPGLNVIATGGDLTSVADFVLAADAPCVWLRGQRLESNSTHGTGCAFSSALLCALVARKPEPALAAKRYVAEAIRSTVSRGRGKGPLNHLWTR